ncbi:hypothetical protein [Candidatus Villigracilis affinis]|uniref:hypothetical protein n=1 Tax=Candidatus Villigracilis affinis TaxID=3140682 RepID=UPI002A1E8CFD|nr:hypothetical protein [Anaerolineales bacterium]
MPYDIRYNMDGYVEMVHDGVIASKHITSIITAVMSAVKENGCNLFLGDYRRTDLQLSMGMLYEVPKQVYSEAQRLHLKMGDFKRALVVSEVLYEKFKFFELVSLNRMQNVRVFTNMDDAKAWLLEK